MKEITSCRFYFQSLSETIARIPHAQIDAVADVLVRAYERQRTVFLFGNGGSAALASHFACDLAKGTIHGSAKRFKAHALTDNIPLMTAWANDSDYENIFSEQLANFVARGDVAFAISGSGNSPNVLKALKTARQAGAVTIGLTGFAGGQMRPLCDAAVIIPSDNMQLIEDLHVCVTHSLFTCIRFRIGSYTAPIFTRMGPSLVRTAGK
jgi:D-sedoheptulose 7-phosphate isomerase